LEIVCIHNENKVFVQKVYSTGGSQVLAHLSTNPA
jgi:hypothetical protein